MSNSKRNGKGKYIWADGSYYNGEWAENSISGDGTLTIKNGFLIEGTFVDNKLASGTASIIKGTHTIVYSCINGSYTNNVSILSSSREYSGTFTNNDVTGYGTLELDRDSYVGNFVEGKRQGTGTYTWSDGDKYVGSWKEDEMNGYGTYYWGDVQRLAGNFVDNKPNGTCYYYTSDGTRYVTTWANGTQTNIYRG